MTAKKITIHDGNDTVQESSEEQAKKRDADLSALNGDSVEPSPVEVAESQPAASEEGGSLVELELKAEVDEFRTKYLRALADLENFKKRTQRERAELLKYQGEKILLDFVEVLDNLELALEHADADPAKLREGVELISKQFQKAFDKWEVRARPGVGAPFDPNHQNALSRMPTSEHQPGTVVNELKKTYFYKDRLLRPGEVVVAAEPAAEPQSTESSNEPDLPSSGG